MCPCMHDLQVQQLLDWDLERCQESLDLIKKHEEVAWHLTHGVIRTFAPLIRSYSRIISSFRSYSFVLFRPLCHHRRCQHGVSFYASFVQLRSKRLLLNCFLLWKWFLFSCSQWFSWRLVDLCRLISTMSSVRFYALFSLVRTNFI
jgi:hypothetical protein